MFHLYCSPLATRTRIEGSRCPLRQPRHYARNCPRQAVTYIVDDCWISRTRALNDGSENGARQVARDAINGSDNPWGLAVTIRINRDQGSPARRYPLDERGLQVTLVPSAAVSVDNRVIGSCSVTAPNEPGTSRPRRTISGSGISAFLRTSLHSLIRVCWRLAHALQPPAHAASRLSDALPLVRPNIRVTA